MATDKATTSADPKGEPQADGKKSGPKSDGGKHPWLKSYPPDIKWDTEIPERRLYALLDHAVSRYAKQQAIDFLGKTMTYADLADHVDRALFRLHDQVVRRNGNGAERR